MPDFDVVYSGEVPNKNIMSGRIFGSIITVTGVFGLVMANYAVKYIIKH